MEIILSRGHGYRFADVLSVRRADQATITDIRDMGDEMDVRNQNVRDDRNVTDEASGARQD